MLRIGRHSEFLFMRTTNAMQSAQTLDAIEASKDALREQLTLDLLGAVALGHPVDATAALMCRFDGNNQAHLVELTR